MLFELIMFGAAVIAMYRIAEFEEESGLLWVVFTFAICLACFTLIPLPYIRIFIGFAAAFVGIIVKRVITET